MTLSVLHAVVPAPVGGLESVIAMLARGRHRAGNETAVAAVVEPHEQNLPFFEPLEAAGVPVERLRVPHRRYRREWRAWDSVLRARRPDVVHTHGAHADVMAGAVARRRGIPLVSTVHGFTGGDWKNRLYEVLQRLSHRRFDAVVAVSGAMVPRLRAAGVPAGLMRVVRNAWTGGGPLLPRAEAREALGAHPDRFLIGWVGRLTREKGADVLLRALPHLDEIPLEAAFVGAGRELPRLRGEAERLGVASRVRFRGSVPDASSLFPAFDVFALSSRTEGIPIVLFEAMEARVPIVAAAVGGVPEVVRDGREALLVPPERPEALAAAIRRVQDDPAGAARRAAAAERRLRAEFGEERWLAEYEAVYREVCGAAPPEGESERGRGEWSASLSS